MPIFKKILSRKKWQPFWIFEFFAKIAKHKNAYISKTVLDRAISTKFLTRRISLQSSHAYFQKKFVSPKMAAILNFPQNCKTYKNAYISKTVLDRAISTKFLTHRVSLQSSHANFQNIFVSPNIADILKTVLDRADCADFGCHNSIRLEMKHFLNTLALTFISFSGRFVFAMQKHYLFFLRAIL